MSLDSTNMVKFATLAVQELAYPQSVLAPLVVDICGYHAVGATREKLERISQAVQWIDSFLIALAYNVSPHSPL